MYGYTQPLFVLPFDHRSSFAKGLFNSENPDEATIAKIQDMKRLIYEAIFEAQAALKLPENNFAILVDEDYGQGILEDAGVEGFVTIESTEKSGLPEFSFEYGEDFKAHLLNSKLTFAKALVRYNPEGDAEHNQRSLERLKELSDFVHANNIKLLIEPLVPATEAQLASVGGDVHRYDTELRPSLTIAMIRTLQEAGVECDVWKIEGFEKTEHYQAVLNQARNTEERADVSLIILGRNETKENVAKWIIAGKDLPGVIGFAVGRTVFWNPLVEYRDGKISRSVAQEQIAEGFTYFAKIFLA
jgi:myo-inositol catabolism protein IolC